LGAAFLTTNLVALSNAQIVVKKPLRFSSARGLVIDRFGTPISGAKVTLVREGETKFGTTSDPSGRFQIEGDEGIYWLNIKAERYASAGRRAIVGRNPLAVFGPRIIYVVLWPAGCMDDCSIITTSKRKFDRAVADHTGKTTGDLENHAT
jgi:hypothetical protein